MMNFSNLSVKFFLTSILFFTLLISISIDSKASAQSDSVNVIEGTLSAFHASLPDGTHLTNYYIAEDEKETIRYTKINFDTEPSNLSSLLGKRVIAEVLPVNAQAKSLGESSNAIFVSSIKLVDVDGELAARSTPQAATLTGTKNIPSLLVKFADKSITTHTKSYVQDKFYDAPDGLSRLYQTVSYGNFGLSGTATEWKTLPGTRATYWNNLVLIAEHAMQVHREIDYSSIDGLIIVVNGCMDDWCAGWGSLAPYYYNSPVGYINITLTWLPDTTSDEGFGSWSIGEANENGLGTAAHEVGHNLGFGHTTLPPGNWTGGAMYGVYTDMWSIMSGSWDREGPNPFVIGQRSDAGWIPASNKAVVPRGSSETITIDYANEPLTGSNKKMVTLPLPDGTTYILAAHKEGVFSDNPYDNEGIIMYRFYPNGNQFTEISTFGGGPQIKYVLVGTAGTETMSDFAYANLDVGETYTDSANNVTVTTLSKTATSVTVQISNGVAPPTLTTLSINDIIVTEGDSGTTNFDFTVTRSGDTSASSTVSYTTADGTATAPSDYTITSGTASFASGVTQQTITITVNGDTAVESNETFTVNLSTPTGATINDAEGLGTIQNDDTAPPSSATADGIAIYRAGVWYVSTNLDGTPENIVGFGDANDTPLVGDFNGDGTDDIAIYRSGVWYVSTDLDGTPENTIGFGDANDTPLVGDFNGDGTAPIQQTPSSDSGPAFSFGGTLESAKPTFDIMKSEDTTSTYGKQGYSYGFRAVGVGVSEINSEKICGLSTCSEKMSTAEKIQLYLQSKGLD